MKREEKQKQAEELHQTLEKARTVILSGFEGLTVAQDTELRRKIAVGGGKYKVVKNTLIERAAQGTVVEPVAGRLHGTTSLAYTETDPVALARLLTNYAKDNPALVFRAGVVEGRVVSLADMQRIANLPPREELVAKALFLVNAPARMVAMTAAGVAAGLVRVIKAAVDEKKFAEAAGA